MRPRLNKTNKEMVLALVGLLTSFRPANIAWSRLTAWPPGEHVSDVRLRVYVFEVGQIDLNGESRSLSEDPRVKKAYLGA